MRFLILGRSVGKGKKKTKIKLEKESGARRPGTSAFSQETTRCGYKVNMAAMEEGKIDVAVKIKREKEKICKTKELLVSD